MSRGRFRALDVQIGRSFPENSLPKTVQSRQTSVARNVKILLNGRKGVKQHDRINPSRRRARASRPRAEPVRGGRCTTKTAAANIQSDLFACLKGLFVGIGQCGVASTTMMDRQEERAVGKTMTVVGRISTSATSGQKNTFFILLLTPLVSC